MAKKYQPAIFQPTVRPDWGGTLSYLSDAEKSEILTALVKYPSVECQSKFWLETIKPDLDLQLSRFMNSNAVKSRGALNRWGKISIPYPNHMDTISIPYDKDMDKISNPYGIDTEREREKEKERGRVDENSIFHVDFQNFDEIPPDILPVMKKYWTDEKIEKIRQDLAFMPSHDSSVAILLTKYSSDLSKVEESKVKKPEKKSYGEQQKVKLTDEEFTKLKELYGRRLENAIQILDSYLAQSTKNERKYSNHYAVMRRNNWVYNKTFEGDFVPLKPQVADMSKFVKANPLGEEND